MGRRLIEESFKCEEPYDFLCKAMQIFYLQTKACKDALEKNKEVCENILGLWEEADCIYWNAVGRSDILGASKGYENCINVGKNAVRIFSPETLSIKAYRKPVLVTISGSGSTQQPLSIAKRAKKEGVPLVSITANENGELAKLSDPETTLLVPTHLYPSRLSNYWFAQLFQPSEVVKEASKLAPLGSAFEYGAFLTVNFLFLKSQGSTYLEDVVRCFEQLFHELWEKREFYAKFLDSIASSNHVRAVGSVYSSRIAESFCMRLQQLGAGLEPRLEAFSLRSDKPRPYLKEKTTMVGISGRGSLKESFYTLEELMYAKSLREKNRLKEVRIWGVTYTPQSDLEKVCDECLLVKNLKSYPISPDGEKEIRVWDPYILALTDSCIPAIAAKRGINTEFLEEHLRKHHSIFD